MTRREVPGASASTEGANSGGEVEALSQRLFSKLMEDYAQTGGNLTKCIYISYNGYAFMHWYALAEGVDGKGEGCGVCSWVWSPLLGYKKKKMGHGSYVTRTLARLPVLVYFSRSYKRRF